jgi:hypothetical protein
LLNAIFGKEASAHDKITLRNRRRQRREAMIPSPSASTLYDASRMGMSSKPKFFVNKDESSSSSDEDEASAEDDDDGGVGDGSGDDGRESDQDGNGHDGSVNASASAKKRKKRKSTMLSRKKKRAAQKTKKRRRRRIRDSMGILQNGPVLIVVPATLWYVCKV